MSYYYAHKGSVDGSAAAAPAAAKVYHGPPKLLSVAAAGGGGGAPALKTPITRYSWADGKKVVSVYVTVPGIGAGSTELDLQHTATSLLFSATVGDKVHCLKLPTLNDAIDKATHRVKDDNTVVLKLTKAEEARFTWHELVKKPTADAGGD